MLENRTPNSDPKLWGPMGTIATGQDDRTSLMGRKLRVFLMGEQIEEPSTHPIIAPSVNAMAATDELAGEDEALATINSPLADSRINRFLHIAQSSDDLVDKARMQHALGHRTGTCFQRCVGLDAINTLLSVTLGRNAVGYLTESKHGAGSPQAQRIQIARGATFKDKQRDARRLAGKQEGGMQKDD